MTVLFFFVFRETQTSCFVVYLGWFTKQYYKYRIKCYGLDTIWYYSDLCPMFILLLEKVQNWIHTPSVKQISKNVFLFSVEDEAVDKNIFQRLQQDCFYR